MILECSGLRRLCTIRKPRFYAFVFPLDSTWIQCGNMRDNEKLLEDGPPTGGSFWNAGATTVSSGIMIRFRAVADNDHNYTPNGEVCRSPPIGRDIRSFVLYPLSMGSGFPVIDYISRPLEKENHQTRIPVIELLDSVVRLPVTNVNLFLEQKVTRSHNHLETTCQTREHQTHRKTLIFRCACREADFLGLYFDWRSDSSDSDEIAPFWVHWKW